MSFFDEIHDSKQNTRLLPLSHTKDARLIVDATFHIDVDMSKTINVITVRKVCGHLLAETKYMTDIL